MGCLFSKVQLNMDAGFLRQRATSGLDSSARASTFTACTGLLKANLCSLSRSGLRSQRKTILFCAICTNNQLDDCFAKSFRAARLASMAAPPRPVPMITPQTASVRRVRQTAPFGSARRLSRFALPCPMITPQTASVRRVRQNTSHLPLAFCIFVLHSFAIQRSAAASRVVRGSAFLRCRPTPRTRKSAPMRVRAGKTHSSTRLINAIGLKVQ